MSLPGTPYVYWQRMTPQYTPLSSVGPPLLSVFAIAADYREGVAITFQVRRARVINQACSVRWTAVSSGGAGDLADPLTGIINFSTSSLVNSVDFQVQTVNRDGSQGLRTLTVTLSEPVNCEIAPNLSTASVDFDDDVVPSLPSPILSVTGSNSTFVEGSSLQFLIRRVRSSTQACTVNWSVASAGGVGDLSGTLTGVASFPAGINQVSVIIATVDRSQVQGNRLVTMTLSNPIGAILDPNQTSYGIGIYDRANPLDPPVIQVTGPATTFVEGSAVSFQIRRTHTLNIACSFDWQVTSTGGVGDLSGVTSGTIGFTSDPNVNSATITVQTVDRSGTQGSRDVTLTVSNPTGCTIDPQASSYLVSIYDHIVVADPPMISVTGSGADFIEGDTLHFQIVRGINFITACSVHWAATSIGGSADLAGTLSGTASFTTSASVNSIDIPITTVKRTGNQGNRDVTLTISAPTSCALDPNRSDFGITIGDFAFPADPPLVSVSGSNNAIEEGNDLTFQIVRERAFSACSVGWSVVSDNSGDLSGAVSGTANFPADTVTNTINITVHTVAGSSTPGDRDVTMTIGSPTNCEIKVGGDTFAITLIDQGATFDPTDLYYNPHNAQAAHHRPFGAGAVWCFPPDCSNYGAANPTYNLPRGPGGQIGPGQPGRYFQAGDPSPLVADYPECAGLNGHTGNVGAMVANAGQQGTKLFYLVDPSKTTNNFNIPFDGTVSSKPAGSSYTELWPTFPPAAGDLCYEQAVYFPVGSGADKKSGDCNVLLYPENGVRGGKVVWWDELYLMPGAGRIARNRLTWKIDDVDYRVTGDVTGAGASQIYWPSHVLRGFSINGKFGVARIQHALQATCCRHSKNGASDRAHILGQRNVWPAYGRDSSLAGNETIQNLGYCAYGLCVGIPPWLQYLRNSTTAQPAPGGYMFNLDEIGLALWDCFSDHGLRFLDGSGQVGAGRPSSTFLPSTTASDYGRIEVRTDQGVGPYGTKAADMLTKVETNFKKFMGWINDSKNKTMCVLFPHGNPRPHNIETDQVLGRQAYYGGNRSNVNAGPLYTAAGRCQNTAYNAT